MNLWRMLSADRSDREKIRLLIITGIYPPEIGGPASYVPLVASALSDDGFEVQVLTLSDQRLPRPSPSVPVHTVSRSLWRPIRGLRLCIAIMRLARGSDVILACGLFGIAALSAKAPRRPLIMRVAGDVAWERAINRHLTHDGFADFQACRQRPQVELLKTLRSLVTRRADAVIVPSGYLADAVRGWRVPEDRIHVINNGVTIPPRPGPSEDAKRETFKVVTSSRLISLKRVDGIVRAVESLPNVELIVIGDGPELSSLQSLAIDLGIESKVTFTGRLSAEQALSSVARADLLVLNSTHEGFPHVLLEAMALGVPVVATAVGGTPEIIRTHQDGLLIASEDENGLSKAIALMATDVDERVRLANAGRQRSEHFSASRMIAETAELLVHMANKRRHA